MSRRKKDEMEDAFMVFSEATIGKAEIYNLSGLLDIVEDNGFERPSKSTACRWLRQLGYAPQDRAQFVWSKGQ